MPTVSPRLAWLTVGLLWLAYVINYVDRQVVFSLLPILKNELHFTDVQLGLVGSVFLWVYSLSMPITGRLADLYPRHRLILASLALWSVATFATGMSHSVSTLLFWRFMMGITESLYVPAALSIIAALHTGATRSRALSIHASAQFTGIALGGWYGGWSADHIGWRSGFSLLGVIGVAYSAVLFATFRKLPSSLDRSAVRQSASPLDILKSRSYIALCVAFFAFALILWMLYAWLPNFIYEKYGLSLTDSGSLATLYLQVGSFIGVLAGGALADRFVQRVPAARFYLVATGFLLSVPLAWVMLSVNSLAAVRIASGAFGIFAGLGIANIFAATYDVIAPRNYGLGAGSLNMLGGLSGGAGILAAGMWKASLGVTGLVQISAIVSVILSLALIAVTAVYFDRERSRV